ncbi:hypothetical protein OCC_08045 [Thermococcus litoralis DSM 5473]|uniref:Protease n=1 Tax=Thermococcus litoralis (strain ATCC 51850 / DSM 5473 / JCM 8560 / NS-C) TaxID=523849 RepID=H3ZKJ7_THELN|nr:hypothetical protein [Thermococcus litoralis]EHR79429.1 hypothetical protein OCC_08045 [Thermococcus litoralis DSM 5473]
MRWKLLGILLLGLLILGSFGSANIVKNGNDKACQLVSYWVFENGQWVQKSEPRVWWYCQEPERVKGFMSFAFKEMPYGLFKKPDPMTLHQAARDLINLVGVDEPRGKFSTSLPSYGGMFINEEKGLIFVYVRDEKDKAELKQALGKYRGKVNVVFLKGKYSFEQLVKWKHSMEKLDERIIEQLGITMLDVDEAHNSLTIGLEEITPEKLKLLENRLEKLGIPKEAVRVERREYMKLLADYHRARPLVGGVMIRREDAPDSWGTLGYIGFIGSTPYFVTAGHLGIWGTSGQRIYQPTVDEENYVGTVTYNPYFRDDESIPYRYSDSMLVKADVAGSTKIYNPSPYTSSDYIVIGKRYSADQIVGETVIKVGATTGKTTGEITNKCVTSFLSPKEDYYPDLVALYCQMETNLESAGGDSGAPVFKSYGTFVELYGILWGGTSTVSAYSPIDGIEEDLGVTLDVN